MRTEYLIVIGITILVIVGTLAYVVAVNILHRPSEEYKGKLVVYTYESLLAWGKDKNKTYDKVFGEFERRTGIHVELRVFEDSGTMLATVIEEVRSGNVKADVVIGLDNIQIIKAKREGVLEPYTPPNIDVIPQWLIQIYDPHHYAIPYDYGLIAFVYDTKHISEDVMENLTFESFYNSSLAQTLITEDPRTSSTGLSFLLYQIVVYEKYLGKDWREWWRNVNPRVVSSWGDAYDAFLKEEYSIVVSYATDPAYSMYFYNATRYKAALVKYNGRVLGWLQVEGLGIVKGAPHKEAAKKFIEWFISEEVQREIPLNNWMYPANKYVELPSVYKYAINIEDVEIVNLRITVDEISVKLDKWIDEWVDVMTSG